ncbi:MAG: hypothetical protein A3H33_02090 [Betaproteobacteria bacterium RIFCSPLOWO2_02_FULL_65_20]|nr:MAG: hypothetical protein A3H33_02090 [Betaproteobacteria bacterium RIFCSPLOWO2_02_FULL_65_20]
MLSDAAIEAIVGGASRMPSPLSVLAVYQLGGAARLGAAAFCLNAAATWTEPAESDRNVAWTREFWSAIEPMSTAGAYVNFLGDEGPERARSSYRENYDRLVALKRRYDPKNFFRLNQNIEPGV